MKVRVLGAWCAVLALAVGTIPQGAAAAATTNCQPTIEAGHSVARVWEGGMSSHGGMLGLIIFTFYYAWRHKMSWTNLGDNLVVVAPIGLFFGRCANFINGELYGRVATVPWAMLFPKELLEPENAAEAERALIAAQQVDPRLTTPEAIVGGLHSQPPLREVLRPILTPRHPSQIYEALLEQDCSPICHGAFNHQCEKAQCTKANGCLGRPRKV